MHKYARPSYVSDSKTTSIARIIITVILLIVIVLPIVKVMKDTADSLHDQTVELNNNGTP